jgi:MSHA biogenesis protein MshP
MINCAIRRRQKGFLVIAGVFLLVVLGGLVAYLTTVSATSQAASAADLNSARAYQAARAGAEWAAYHILRNPVGGTFKAACDAANNPLSPTKVNLTFGSTLSAFTATVKCSSASFTEGADNPRVYSITSNACNEPSAGDCENATAVSGTYVDREVSLTIAQ